MPRHKNEVILRPLWFVENQIDTEYQAYRVMAFEQSAISDFSVYKLMPHYELAGSLNKAVECFLAVDTVYAYMMQDKEDHALLVQLDSMDRSSPTFDEMKTYVGQLQPTFAEIYRVGDSVRRFCEARMTFTKQPGLTKRIFVQNGDTTIIQKYKLKGERMIADGQCDGFPSMAGDVFVQLDREFPLDETVIPVIQLNLWRFLD